MEQKKERAKLRAAMRSDLTDASFNSDVVKEITERGSESKMSNYASVAHNLARISEEPIVEIPKIEKQRTEDCMKTPKEAGE